MIWWLEIDEAHLDHLRPVRHWGHLSMTAGPGVYWVKDLRPDDPDRKEIRSIPFKRILYLRDDHLFPAGSLVPLRQVPGGLQWIPLEKGLPLQLPSFNHNYFGVGERVTIRLVPSSKEEPPAALLVPTKLLQAYADTASSIRLRHLNWVVLDGEALVIGAPILPLPGEVYWRQGDHLLPAGFGFAFPVLAEIAGLRLNLGGGLLLWDKAGTCLPIAAGVWRPLSRSSVRLTGSDPDHHRSSLTS